MKEIHTVWLFRLCLFLGFQTVWTIGVIEYIGDCNQTTTIVQECLHVQEQIQQNDSVYFIGKHNAHLALSKDFHVYEFLSKDPEAPEVYPLSKNLVEGLQLIRDYFDTPIVITSGFRGPEYNKLKGGVEQSQHVTGFAIDCGFPVKPEIIELINLEVHLQGRLFQQLLQCGITGFGVYNGHLHLGAANRPGAFYWDSFEYNYWNSNNSLTTAKIHC